MASYEIDPRMHNDRRFIALSPHGRCLWVLLLTGPQRTGLPGLQITSVAALAATQRYPLDVVEAAMAEITASGMAVYDPDTQVLSLPKQPGYVRSPNGNTLRGWFRRWQEIPECPLKYEYPRILIQTAHRKQWIKQDFSRAWDETFGAEGYQLWGEDTPNGRPATGQPPANGRPATGQWPASHRPATGQPHTNANSDRSEPFSQNLSGSSQQDYLFGRPATGQPPASRTPGEGEGEGEGEGAKKGEGESELPMAGGSPGVRPARVQEPASGPEEVTSANSGRRSAPSTHGAPREPGGGADPDDTSYYRTGKYGHLVR